MARERANPRRASPKDRQSLESTKPLKDPSTDSIEAAEEVALNAFAAGLRLAAAFGTVAAKTTSLALASLASGADKFSELVKKEALATKPNKSTTRIRQRTRKKGTSR
jgi:hypothetical protein